MTQQLKIYVSGQIKGLDRGAAQIRFEQAANHLKRLGHQAFNPMQMFPYNRNWTYTDYLIADLRVLMEKCDAIYMLDNWVVSRGARIELATATTLEYPIFYEHFQEPYFHSLTL